MYFEKSLRFVFKISLVFGCIMILEKYVVKGESDNLRKQISLGKDLLIGLNKVLKPNRSLYGDFNLMGFNETAYFMNS